MINKTVRAHFDYYEELSKRVSVNEIQRFLKVNNLSLRKLKERYKRDRFLRNLNSHIFDSNIHSAALCEPNLLELVNACLWKHILIFKVLGARPRFVSSNNFFKMSKV